MDPRRRRDPKSGRPKLPAYLLRKHIIKVSCNDEEFAKIVASSRRVGIKHSVMLRQLGLQQPLPEPPTGRSFDATALHALNQTWQQSSSLRNELRRIGVNLNQIATSANAGRLLEQSLMAAQADLQAAMKRLDENADRAAGIINSMEDGDEEDQP